MLVIFHLLLLLRAGRCSDDLIFETKTVAVGNDVTLSCTRQKTWHSTDLFWIRLVPGTSPEVLGGMMAYDYDGVKVTHHIQAKQRPGTFVLDISKAQLNDTAVYYCIKVRQRNMTFLKGIFLRIKGSEPGITAVIQVPPSGPVRPGDSVTLQCSVLSDSERKTCPGDHSVYWFRAGSHESHPSLLYAHGNRGDECENSTQKCVYSFSKKNVSSSDAGTYYCAVATCGEILFGNGTKLITEVSGTCMWSEVDRRIVFLLCFVLAITLVVIISFIWIINENKCDCCKAAVALQNNSGVQRSQQRDEDTWVYSAVIFTMMKTDSGAVKDGKAADRERIYAAGLVS